MTPYALGLAALAQAPSERPVTVVTRVAHAPVVDGRLDEEVWRTAPPIGPLRQMEPGIDVDPSEETDIRLVTDGRALYFGIRCYDRDPAGIVATLRQRDADLDPDDRIEIILDTFRDRRNAYFFQIGAAGSLGDALMGLGEGSFKKAWDGIFDGAARIDELGWSAEIEIPFATVAFDPHGSTWGFNVNRCIKRKEEFCRWAAHTRDSSFFRIAQAGDVQGFSGLEQGLGIDLVPFFVLRAEDERGEDASITGQPGFDATWRITPELQAALTVNTDFAETEVDDRQINLTRFPLFFPEKRDFFLQDAGIFDFGGLTAGTLLPFFSRRIGLDAAGEEVPIEVGAKLTGRAGRWDIGLLDVQTGSTGELEGQNLGVARVSYDLGEQSSLGVIGTAGDPVGGRDATTYGADLTLATDELQGDKNLRGNLWFVRTDDGAGGGDDLAYGVALSYPNDLWSWYADASEIQERFDPRLGFVPRTGIRDFGAGIQLEPRLTGAVRRLELSVDGTVITDLDGEVETAVVEVQPLGVELDSGDSGRFELVGTHERLDEEFEIEEGIVIAPGEYDFLRGRVELEASDKRVVSGEIALETGSFFDGTRTDWEAGILWRPSALLNASVEYVRNDVDLDDGAFTVHVGRARLALSFTTKVQWSNFVQFDNQSDTAALQSRLRWSFGPGRELFLVLNPTFTRDDGGLLATETAAAFKVGYTLRF